MKYRLTYIGMIILFFFIAIPPTFASYYMDLYDDWDWDTGTTYDTYIWDDYGAIAEVNGEDWNGDDADAVCLDFDYLDENGFDYCFYDGTVEECDEVSSSFNIGCNKGCEGGYSGEDIDVTDDLDYDGHDVVLVTIYYDCDESEGSYTWEDDYEWYYVYDARRTDCASSGSNTFYHEARDEYDNQWDSFSTHYCSSEHDSYWGCATWDEETDYTAEDSFDEDPCKIKDGDEEGNACSSSSDCISQGCDGEREESYYDCDSDGSADLLLIYDYYYATCGGAGYYDFSYFNYDDPDSCTDPSIGGSGYVCDEAHDDYKTTQPTDPDTPCRKDIGESCSQTTDCWNDDGGNWCNTINECTDGANGRDCGSDSDCNSGYCCNSICSATSCGNETDLAILDVIPIQVIPNVDMVKGKSGYVRVIVHNYGPLNATGKVNVTFEGTSLTPYNPTNASKAVLVGTNETFDFIFKPDVDGNSKIISANVVLE